MCLILSLSVIGCSDFYNWAYVEEDQYVEDNLDEREDEGEIEIDYKNKRKEYLDTYKDSELEKRDVDVNKTYYENEEKQYIDTYKDSELEKIDKAGNKTYWSNEQDPEF